MELKQLFYFVKISENKSFSLAAKDLFLTQQALSNSIKKLEEELDVPLFIRRQNGLELTVYGKLVYAKAKQIFCEVDALEKEVAHLKKRLDKKVSVSISYGVLSTISPDMLTQFQLSHSDIELVIRDYPDQICEDRVLNDQADIGCVVGPIDGQSFKSKLLFSEDLYLLINKESELANVENISVEHLRNQEYLLSSDDFNISKAFKSFCKEQGFSPKVNFISNEFSLLEKLVSFNKGIALIPNHHLSRIVDPNLCTKKLVNTYLDWKVYLIKKEGKVYPECVDRLWHFLMENFNRYVLEF